MTHAVVREAWDKVQADLESSVGEQNYRLYLKNTLIVQLHEGLAEVGVPNLTIADYVEHKFSSAILDSIERCVGYRPSRIKFSINGHLFRKLRENERSSQKPAADAAATVAAQAPARPREHEGVQVAPQVFLLNPRYRLDNFIVGPSNKLAFNCAVETAKKPGRKFNPLFIYGGCGLGKSHLLQGISRKLAERDPAARTLYVSAEYFVNQFVHSLSIGRIDAFRERFRTLDALIIDDIHFLRGKEKSQEELLHTLTTLETLGRQVVLASDLHPKELVEFKDSLRSRFVQGMVAQLAPPAAETRLAIIKSKIVAHRHLFPNAVVEFLGAKLECNIRELEGYLTQLAALSGMTGEALTVPVVQQALADFLTQRRRLVDLGDIENVVIAHFGVTSELLHSRVRRRNIATARQMCLYLARTLTQYSLKEIGRFFGDKSHSTVVFAVQRMESAIAADPAVRAAADKLRRQLTQT